MLLLQEFAEHWGVITLRGLVALGLGLLMVTYPGKSLVVVTFLLGLWILVEGTTLMLMALYRYKLVEGWSLLFLQGLLGLVIGLLLMAMPAVSLAVVVFMVGLWLIVGGIVLFIQALQVRKELLGGEWLLIATAIVSLVFGLILMGNVTRMVMMIGWLAGVMMIVLGLMITAFGFQVKGDSNKIAKLQMY